MQTRIFLAIAAILILCAAGCSSSDSGDNGGSASSLSSSVIDYQSVLDAQGYKIIDSVTTGDDTGYLAENKAGKKCVVLKGSAFNMGYQFGRLMPEATYRMTTEYPFNMVADFIGFSKESAPGLFDLIFKTANALCEGAVKDRSIPSYLLEEMKGMAAGATDGGFKVKYEDVLLVNEGIDALYSIILSGIVPALNEANIILKNSESAGLVKIEDGRVFFPKANLSAMGCNGFVVSGKATVGGNVYHGRDFMFPTGGYYHKLALMAVYLPDDGLPFVTLAAPGFVGLTTGLNAEGVSMGVDVVFGAATRATPGTGCLLVVRDIIQNSASLDDAVSRMKKLNRGVSWLYVLADRDRSTKYTNGIVCETGMKEDIDGNEFTYAPDLFKPLEKLLYAGLIRKLEKLPKAEDGVMVRDQNWVYPESFEGVQNFDGQKENIDDLVVATNHYIIPNMAFTTLTPLMLFMAGAEKKTSESVERYDDLLGRLTADGVYGHIDYDTAKNLIDFMNPNRNTGQSDPWNGYYKVDGQVGGHHDIFDNTNLTMECLYGYYHPDEPWAKVDLKPFAGTDS
jgi:hypothetical protein